MPTNKKDMVWKCHLKNTFDEILGYNDNMFCMKIPLKSAFKIISLAAQQAAKTDDEKLIGYFARLAIYDFSNPNHQDYNQEMTDYYINKTL